MTTIIKAQFHYPSLLLAFYYTVIITIIFFYHASNNTKLQYNIFTLLVIISLTSSMCTVHDSQIVSITIHQLI